MVCGKSALDIYKDNETQIKGKHCLVSVRYGAGSGFTFWLSL